MAVTPGGNSASYPNGLAKVFATGGKGNDVDGPNTSRQDILNAIRSHDIQGVELPSLEGLGVQFDDPMEQFGKVLSRVGGQLVCLDDMSQVSDYIQSMDVFQNSKQILCRLPDSKLDNVNLDKIADPHDLAGLDLAILTGEFAVAENAAVWVTDRALKHRVGYVIAEHLIMVVDAQELVHHMHEAYERITFSKAGYGLFIAGPSKTADIGATLVKGAHGACTYHVIFVGT